MSVEAKRFVNAFVAQEVEVDKTREAPFALDAASARVAVASGVEEILIVPGRSVVCLMGLGADKWYACSPLEFAASSVSPLTATSATTDGQLRMYALVPDGASGPVAETKQGGHPTAAPNNVASVDATATEAVTWRGPDGQTARAEPLTLNR